MYIPEILDNVTLLQNSVGCCKFVCVECCEAGNLLRRFSSTASVKQLITARNKNDKVL